MCEFCKIDPLLKADGEIVEGALTEDQRRSLVQIVNKGMMVMGRHVVEKKILGGLSAETRELSKDYLREMEAWKEDVLKTASPEVAEVLFRRIQPMDFDE